MSDPRDAVVNLNHNEAHALALFKSDNSNLARCYLDLERELATAKASAEQVAAETVERCLNALQNEMSLAVVGQSIEIAMRGVDAIRKLSPSAIAADVARMREDAERYAIARLYIAPKELADLLCVECPDIAKDKDIADVVDEMIDAARSKEKHNCRPALTA